MASHFNGNNLVHPPVTPGFGFWELPGSLGRLRAMFGLVSQREMVRRVFTRAIKCCGLSSSTVNPSTWNFRAGRDAVFLQFELLLSLLMRKHTQSGQGMLVGLESRMSVSHWVGFHLNSTVLTLTLQRRTLSTSCSSWMK